jgi:hypothetical protein
VLEPNDKEWEEEDANLNKDNQVIWNENPDGSQKEIEDKNCHS